MSKIYSEQLNLVFKLILLFLCECLTHREILEAFLYILIFSLIDIFFIIIILGISFHFTHTIILRFIRRLRVFSIRLLKPWSQLFFLFLEPMYFLLIKEIWQLFYYFLKQTFSSQLFHTVKHTKNLILALGKP